MNNLVNSSICRSCLSKKDHLINPLIECDPINDLKYANAYYLCTNILINKADSLPMMLCQDCIYELQRAYQFQYRAKKSNDALLKSLNSNTKSNTKNIFVHNSAATTVQTEHGYSFSLSALPESIDNNDEEINLNLNDKNNYVIDKVALPDSEENDDVEEIKYSILEIDENEFAFNCANCGEGFVTNDSLQEHLIGEHSLRNKTLVGNFRCTECNENLASETELNEHKKEEHFLTENSLCGVCGAIFSDPTSLDEHFMSTHQDHQQTDEENNTEYDEIDTVKKRSKVLKYLCSICGKNFTTNQRLRIHTYTHTGERNYECDLCTKKFATEFRLRSHRRTHTGERPYECSICKLRFAQANALTCHKRIHTGEKPYECPYCSKKFSQNTILKTHLTLHTGKTIQCPDCDKKFSRASFLILHRREHTGEKPYACDRCPNRYKQKNHLDRHMDIHNGVKFKCTVCNKEYSKQYSLKMHMFTHSDKKPFNCPHCTASFIRSDRYKSHLTIRHAVINY